MATQAHAGRPGSESGQHTSIIQFVDRWIYVMMAAYLIVIVLVGFVPDSVQKVAAVDAGLRPPFPVAMHVHALLMGSWMVLLLSQTTLMATGRRSLHMQLGIVGMILAPALVVAGVVLVPTNIAAFLDFAAEGPPEVKEQVAFFTHFMTNIALLQFRAGICFLLLVALALANRKRDAGLHKRLIILATIVPTPAAFDRMTFLPHSLPASPLTVDLWPLVAIAPMFLWDLYRQRRIHPAYWIYAAIMVPTGIILNLLWDTEWWHRIGGSIIGLPA